MTTTPAVLLVAPLPPPFGGQSVLAQSILTGDLASRYRFVVLDIAHGLMPPLARAFLTPRLTLRMVRLLTANSDIRLVHIHSSAGIALFEKAAYIVIARAFGRDVVLHVHGGRLRQAWRGYGSVARALLHCVLARCRAVIALADSWRAFYVDDVRFGGEIFVLPNAVRVEHLPRHRTESGIRLLYVGQLKCAKGLLDLAAALTELQPPVPDHVVLTLVGSADDPEEEAQIRRAFAACQPIETEFLGTLTGSAKWRVFADADVFVLPSHSEDMPITVLEALGCGLPVVATNVGAVPEMMTDGREGILVPPHDRSALRQAVGRLIASPKLRAEMGVAGRASYARKHTFQQYENDLGAIYDHLIKDRRS